jgi:hypothetical protein
MEQTYCGKTPESGAFSSAPACSSISGRAGVAFLSANVRAAWCLLRRDKVRTNFDPMHCVVRITNYDSLEYFLVLYVIAGRQLVNI